jgi:protein HOOK3
MKMPQALEKQNAGLVDKNASLEEEYRKVSAFKPLMESYKSQIAELESKASLRTQEVDALKFELEQQRTKLKISMEERVRDSETLELYQERMRELELSSHRPIASSKSTNNGALGHGAGESPEPEFALGDADGSRKARIDLGGELDDAMSGTTMTDLKLQIRKLTRELDSVKRGEADNSRILVLENLLDDANRMKARYEADYLAAHREKLVLQRDLEEIRSGRSMGDG